MDTFDIHLMKKDDGERKLNWMIYFGTILVLLVIALVVVIRFIFKKEMEVVLPFSVPGVSNVGNPFGDDTSEGIGKRRSG